MQGVPQGAPFMFIRVEVTHCAVDAAKNPGDVARARRGVLREGLRLRLARPLDPRTRKRIIPAKKTSKVAHGARPVFSAGRPIRVGNPLPCDSRFESSFPFSSA